MFTAALIFSFALNTNQSLFIRGEGPPLRDRGVRLEVHAPLPYDFYLDIMPYVWKSKNYPEYGNGGATLRLGWENKHFGVAVMHNSEHNFDRASRGGYINVNMVEVKWKMK